MKQMYNISIKDLPGLNCGLCGARTCDEFVEILVSKPEEIKRCIHLDSAKYPGQIKCHTACSGCLENETTEITTAQRTWSDSLGREFDFVLHTFSGDPGPREVIIPHNPMRTRELNVQKNDILIGRPLGMSCGCPITHCGYVIDVDHTTGVITWCVTGPLKSRQQEYKDLGYYSAQAYEGIVRETRKTLRIGERYWFLPNRCMLQWRHSGIINFINKKQEKEFQIRIEGLYIG